MALLDYEHFARETNSNLPNWMNLFAGWGISADLSGPFGYGRYATGLFGRTIPNSQILWWNSHIYLPDTGARTDIYYFRDTGSVQIRFGNSADGRLQIFRGDGTLLAQSSAATTSINTWHFLQIRVLIANAGGNVQVWWNGNQVINFTGDTQNTGNAYINEWVCSNSNARTANHIIYDETAGAPSARTPETRIYADLPNGAGATTLWTPSAAANYQNVDEQPNDGDTTYNSTLVATTEDTYACPATVPAGSVIYAVAVEIDARKDDAGSNDVDVLLRSSAINYQGGTPLSLTTAYQRHRHIWSADPAGGSWTVAQANAAQPGVRRTL